MSDVYSSRRHAASHATRGAISKLRRLGGTARRRFYSINVNEIGIIAYFSRSACRNASAGSPAEEGVFIAHFNTAGTAMTDVVCCVGGSGRTGMKSCGARRVSIVAELAMMGGFDD